LESWMGRGVVYFFAGLEVKKRRGRVCRSGSGRKTVGLKAPGRPGWLSCGLKKRQKGISDEGVGNKEKRRKFSG